MTPTTPIEGEHRKAAALEAHAARRAAFVRRGQRALLTALLATGTATADDVRDAVELPPGINPKVFGAVPGPLARTRIIESAGFQNTTRPEAHARPVKVWRLADRAKAERWLRDHPDQPDPSDNGRPDARQGLLFDVAESATMAGL